MHRLQILCLQPRAPHVLPHVDENRVEAWFGTRQVEARVAHSCSHFHFWLQLQKDLT